jgi:hypothetical protein
MSPDTHHSHGGPGYDQKDVSVRAVMWISAVTVGIIVLSVLFVDQYVTMQSEEAKYELRLKPENPQLLELRAHEQTELAAVKVIDTVKGIYQIPIDRAMQLVAEQYKAKQVAPVSPGGTQR